MFANGSWHWCLPPTILVCRLLSTHPSLHQEGWRCEDGCFKRDPWVIQGEKEKLDSRVPWQCFSSWFNWNLQPETLKKKRKKDYNYCWKKFGKRPRMAGVRARGARCTGTPRLGPQHGHPRVRPHSPHLAPLQWNRISREFFDRQFFYHSLMASDKEHLKFHLTQDKGT